MPSLSFSLVKEPNSRSRPRLIRRIVCDSVILQRFSQNRTRSDTRELTPSALSVSKERRGRSNCLLAESALAWSPNVDEVGKGVQCNRTVLRLSLGQRVKNDGIIGDRLDLAPILPKFDSPSLRRHAENRDHMPILAPSVRSEL
jgi:hypothetical protein